MVTKRYYVIIGLGFIIGLFGHYFSTNSFIQFGTSIIALIMLAGLLGKATESVAHYAGQRVGGFLNATFGNAAELIISIFLIKKGLLFMVKASITGSIIGNLLLVLGASLFAGGLKYKIQTFNTRLAGLNGSILLFAVVALFIPASFYNVLETKEAMTYSIIVASLLIVTYLLWIFFSMFTHKKMLTDEGGEEKAPPWSKWVSLFLLLIATLGVAVVSDWLVDSIEDVALHLGWSELFVGAFVIAIVGNAAEHSAAVLLAMKNKIGASVEIAIGSSIQIALFVGPVLVLISLLLGNPMDLIFTPVELIAIIVSVLLTKSVVDDGESNWFEGVLLLAVYLILGTAFYFA